MREAQATPSAFSILKQVCLAQIIYQDGAARVCQSPRAAVTSYHNTTGSCGGQRVKSRCWRGLDPSEFPRGESFLASSSFWWLQAFLGLWVHDSTLCLWLYTALFFWSVSPPCVSCKGACHWIEGPPGSSKLTSSGDS